MADLPTIGSYLFKTAALLNAISVPGHIIYGWKHLDPVLHSTLTHTSEHRVADACANVGWDHMTVGILTAAILNYRWSMTRGPQQTDEKIIFWSLLVGGWYVGRRFWSLREYRPLGCLWVAPVAGLIGWSLV
ncbi:uncharacterized protein HMPREF1541_03351 [Cyphellophora europaea CBS 101466]|uniref:Uncharacterized protein n=1 Tax=Cyphellophora europaea (strain CBS 101466) TaxID=1220924 RepID=W2RY51_CYPE1|nr:uncharacterized protein HMPREF1541_03351 [Cyphellophora europaea CBS 101466]ETN41416.1 hypothetical protein HMPREF1541_03351 [Cyphellophora europaea CBS 101466]